MTLYLTDLDGTLLTSGQALTPYTAGAVNRFIEGGGLFSYATARSRVTASTVTAGLTLTLPVVCYNGAFIYGSTGEIKTAHYFTGDKLNEIRQALTARGVTPMVHAYINGVEKFSFIEDETNPGLTFHLTTRPGDVRRRAVTSHDELYAGDVFYVVCIGSGEALLPLRDAYKKDPQVQCLYQRDLYYDAMWCELLPAKATKAQGALALMEMLGCKRLVAFGDGINDLPLFEIADERYAVANAVPELKAIATAVLGGNNEDGVAKWLAERL
jgi:hypothetical protein